MVGSFSDRPRIVNDVSSVFKDFLRNFGMSFFVVAGTVFGEVGSRGTPVAPRIVNEVSYVMRSKYVSLSA